LNTAQQSHSILVVDAQVPQQQAFYERFAEAGLVLFFADSTEQVTAQFSQLLPDLVLIHLLAGNSEGLALCQQLATAPQAVPIFALTQQEDPALATTAFSAGVADVLVLPADSQILIQRCLYHIRSSQNLQALRRRERILEQAERIAKIGSWEWDSKKRRLYVSREFNRILGFAPDFSPRIRDVLQRVPEEERRKLIDHFQQADSRHQPRVSLYHRIANPNGLDRMLRHEARFIVHSDQNYSVYGTIHDITDDIARQDQILQLAYYDSLTQLPNRTFFRTHLEYAINQVRQQEHSLAVIVMDLDLFTRVNNSLGHAAGDELLKKVANRLLQAFPDTQCTALNKSAIDPQMPGEPMGDKIARLEGDQFAILINRFTRLDDVILYLQRLLTQLTSPFNLRNTSIVLTASVGIALYPVNGMGSELLLRNADAAMHFAKSRGRNNFQFYSSDIDSKSKERLSVESDLRHAIRHDELELYYQPKLHLKTGTIQSVEALVRWNHPIRGMISPTRFVPMAEEIGLINELGEWLINRACWQAKRWNEAGLPPIRVAINLSPIQFRGAPLVEMIRNALLNNWIQPAQLEVEVTETLLLEDTIPVLRTLQGIRNLGVRVALDDFGTGYSSLSYLTRFPFNTLKIDRSFISQSSHHGQAAIIIHSIIQLCKNLNLEVVAEGVENYEELAFLREHRCDVVQGHYFSPALSADELTDFVRQQSWATLLNDPVTPDEQPT